MFRQLLVNLTESKVTKQWKLQAGHQQVGLKVFIELKRRGKCRVEEGMRGFSAGFSWGKKISEIIHYLYSKGWMRAAAWEGESARRSGERCSQDGRQSKMAASRYSAPWSLEWIMSESTAHSQAPKLLFTLLLRRFPEIMTMKCSIQKQKHWRSKCRIPIQKTGSGQKTLAKKTSSWRVVPVREQTVWQRTRQEVREHFKIKLSLSIYIYTFRNDAN